MIDITNLCFGQRIDPELGILEPWYTNPAMDKIKTWDLSGKYVLEYGAGDSTIWWLMKGCFMRSIEHNYEWFNIVREKSIERGFNDGRFEIFLSQSHEGDQSLFREQYIHHWDYLGKPDIVIVDGIHRYECIEHTVNVLKPNVLIVDNWQQAFVFMCPAAEELLKNYKCEIFTQENHEDHDGINKWKTAIFYLNEKAD